MSIEAAELIGTVNNVQMFGIKSTQAATIDGQIPAALEVGPTGFVAHGVTDRGWTVEYDGYFVSQRGYEPGTRKASFLNTDSKLATVAVDIQPDHIAVFAPGRAGGHLEIATALPRIRPETTRVHGHALGTLDQGPEANQFFTRFLGRGARLMRADPDRPRYIPKLYWRDGASNQVAAADGFPFMMLNQTSWDELHRGKGLELGAVSIARLRANLEVELDEPFIEDYLQRVAVTGGFIADVVKPCKRCSIPNNDQVTGVPDNAANKILGIRAGDIAVPGAESDSGMYMGSNLNHQESSIGSVITKGAKIYVLQKSGEPNVRLRSAA